MTSYVTRRRMVAGLLVPAGAVALSVFGLTACETGFIPTEPPLLRSVSGFVRVPASDTSRFASAQPLGAERMFAALFPAAHAEIFGMVPVPNAIVRLVRLDENGEVIATVGETTTNASGQYGFTDSPVPDSRLAVHVVGDDEENDIIRAFVTGRNVDITPASEAVTRTVIDDLVQVESGVVLSNFAVQEVAAIANVIAGLDIDVMNPPLGFDDAVAAIRTAASPLLERVALAFSSPGFDTRLSNAQFGAVDFVPVLKEPTALNAGDGGLELRTDLANWGFDELGVIAGGQIAPGTPHAGHNFVSAFAVQSAGGTLIGQQHVVTDDGQVLVGDAAADASLGAVTADGGFMVYPRTVLENSGAALGRGLRIATRKGNLATSETIDNVGGTPYHLVRLRETLSGLRGGVGQNAISVAAETGTVVFNGIDLVSPAPGENLYGTADFTVTASDQLLVDLDNVVTSTTAANVDPLPGLYQVINDGTVLFVRGDAAGGFLGQGQVTANGGLVSMQTASNLIQIPLNVLTNDSASFEGDELTITSIVPDSLAGTITISATGRQVLYAPASNESGPQSFTYTVSDGAGGEATASVQFEVSSTNTRPMPVDDTWTVAARSINTLNVLDNDIEVDIGQGILVDSLVPAVATLPDSGSIATIVGSGLGNVIRYTPAFNWLGTEDFAYRLRDGFGETSDAPELGTVTVTTVIDGENAPPVPGDDDFNVPAGSPAVALDVMANDIDPDALSNNAHPGWTVAEPWEAPVLSITAVNGSTDPEVTTVNGGTVTRSGNALSYAPAPAFSGIDSFSYTLFDGVDAATGIVTVAVVSGGNLPPEANDDSYRVAVGSTSEFTVRDNDSDPQPFDTLTVSAVDATSLAGGTVSTDGDTVTYVAPAEAGPDSFSYVLSDAAGATSVATVRIVVGGANVAPEAVSDVFRVRADTPTVLDVLANDSDPDFGDTLAISGVEGESAQGGSIDLTAGVLTYTPPPATIPDGNGDPVPFTGTDSFTYTVSDGEATTEATVSVTVMAEGANDAPVAVDDREWYVAMNDGSDPVYTLDVLANDVELDPGDTLAIAGVGLPTDPSAVAALSQNGSVISFTPAADFTGSVTFVYTISDSSSVTSTATVTVGVLDPASGNTPPRAVEDNAWRVAVGSSANVLDVLANDSDPDAGDTLTIVAVELTAPAAPGDPIATPNGSVTIVDGTLVYTPGAAFSGNDTFTYTVEDAAGASATATVRVSVSDVNLPPVTVDDSFHVGLNTTTRFAVLANDSDPNLGQSLNLVTTLGTPSQGGQVAITGVASGVPANTQIDYRPAANFRGVETFTYTATDNNGGQTVGTVTVTVTGGNSPPAGTNDAFTVRTDGVDIVLDVLGNDVETDVDDALTVVGVGGAQNGVVTISQDGTRVLYTPNAGFEGTDGFSYTLRDSRGVTSTASVELTVSVTAPAPVQAVDDLGWRLVLPSDPTLWVTNLSQREAGIAIRQGSGMTESALSGTYNLVQHAGYVFADAGGPTLGAGYSFGTVSFDGGGAITGGAVFGRRISMDVAEARVGDPANSLLIVPLPSEAQAVSGSYDISESGVIEIDLTIADTVIRGRGAVSADGEVVALAVRLEEGGDDSGRGLLFLVRQQP